MKRWIGSLLALLLLAGCTGQPSAEEIVRRAQAAIENNQQGHSIVEAEINAQGERFHLVGEGWMDGEARRATVLEASVPELVGTLMVTDGTTGWLYHPEADKVLTGNRAQIEAYLADSAQGEMPSQSLDINSLSEMVDELLRISDETLVGSESIAGLDAWHLSLVPNAEAPAELSAAGGTVELWISKEYDLPLQLTYTGGALGEGRVTVREYDPKAALDAALFTFTPPAGVEVVEVATLLPEKMTLAEARQQAPFALLSTPQDSAEAALVRVGRLGSNYVQHFEGTLGNWSLTQGTERPASTGEGRSGLPNGSFVTVRGQPGFLISDAERGSTMLAWQEKGITIVLSGNFSREVALKLAESLQ